jgi:predicted transcriptional regulator of viral defense system
LFGLKAVWRAHTKVMVSDIDRTMVDLLDDPSAGGGIQHVADCFGRYLRHKEHRKEKMIEYADRLNNGAVFKRLGFLSEGHPQAEYLLAQCKARLTKGHAKLDPGLESTRLVTRWSLRIPDSWATRGRT